MKIALIGTGYVGLVTGTCFAEVGHEVICVDCDAEKVKVLQQGGIPIYEPGLEELVQKNVAAGRLRFTTSTQEGVDRSQVVFIAVPTPPLPNGSVDPSFIYKSIGR
jgi:UDPglucose 6-dehydrogenase